MRSLSVFAYLASTMLVSGCSAPPSGSLDDTAVPEATATSAPEDTGLSANDTTSGDPDDTTDTATTEVALDAGVASDPDVYSYPDTSMCDCWYPDEFYCYAGRVSLYYHSPMPCDVYDRIGCERAHVDCALGCDERWTEALAESYDPWNDDLPNLSVACRPEPDTAEVGTACAVNLHCGSTTCDPLVCSPWGACAPTHMRNQEVWQTPARQRYPEHPSQVIVSTTVDDTWLWPADIRSCEPVLLNIDGAQLTPLHAYPVDDPCDGTIATEVEVEDRWSAQLDAHAFDLVWAEMVSSHTLCCDGDSPEARPMLRPSYEQPTRNTYELLVVARPRPTSCPAPADCDEVRRVSVGEPLPPCEGEWLSVPVTVIPPGAGEMPQIYLEAPATRP